MSKKTAKQIADKLLVNGRPKHPRGCPDCGCMELLESHYGDNRFTCGAFWDGAGQNREYCKTGQAWNALEAIAALPEPVPCEHSKRATRAISDGSRLMPHAVEENRMTLLRGLKDIEDTPCATPSCGLTEDEAVAFLLHGPFGVRDYLEEDARETIRAAFAAKASTHVAVLVEDVLGVLLLLGFERLMDSGPTAMPSALMRRLAACLPKKGE